MVTMTLTEHEQSELRRMASNVEHFNTMLHDKLLEAAGKDSLPIDQYDRIMGWYRNWLVFNELPLIHAAFAGTRVECLGITAYSRAMGAYRIQWRLRGHVVSSWVPELGIELS